VVKERVRVGWHWVTVRRHGKLKRVKRGGRIEIVKVVKYKERCSRERVKVARHRWREESVCHKPRLVLKSRERVGFGKAVIVHGLLITTQGVPIPNPPVSILTAPNNGLMQYAQAPAVTTGSHGSWVVRFRPVRGGLSPLRTTARRRSSHRPARRA